VLSDSEFSHRSQTLPVSECLEHISEKKNAFFLGNDPPVWTFNVDITKLYSVKKCKNNISDRPLGEGFGSGVWPAS